MGRGVQILVIALGVSSMLKAQHRVTFIVKEQTAIPHDRIFVTGSFNNWDSTGNVQYLMQADGSRKKSIVLSLPTSTIRYKFNRGSWFTVEKLDDGEEVPDRTVLIRSDTVLIDSVTCWRDEEIVDKMRLLQMAKQDTDRLHVLMHLAQNYAFSSEYYNADSAMHYANLALELLQSVFKSQDGSMAGAQVPIEIRLREVLAGLLHSLGNYPKSLEFRLKNLGLAEKSGNSDLILDALDAINTDYGAMDDYQHVLQYGIMMDSILRKKDASEAHYNMYKEIAMSTIANSYYRLGRLNEALSYAKAADGIISDNRQMDTAFSGLLLGDIYFKRNEKEAAFYNYRRSLRNAYKIFNPQVGASDCEGLAKLYQKEGRLDSALYFAKLGLAFLQGYKTSVLAWGENSNFYAAEITPLVADLYNQLGRPDSAYKYLKLSVQLKDSLYNTDKVRQFQTLSFNEAARRQQLVRQAAETKRNYQTKMKLYGLGAVITGFMVLAIVLYRNNRSKRMANMQLQQQKSEIENTLSELRNTQKQLIQSEKMASLGELTAGIAHEIQNPLNFVNNFSEVNQELLAELEEATTHGHLEEAKSMATDIAANEAKINFHGKRADAIVKGMLEHSRTSSGLREPVDLNKLADEFLRLAYHGLRAKDKGFNADMETDFDPEVRNVNMVQQDIGRVLLNLYNNAFYAVKIKQQGLRSGQQSYKPVVQVSTRKLGNQIVVTVRDNGTGIPGHVREKIFQPFFTTKPTGEGTGLGLSLSYDIVKAHGGTICVESSEGAGTVFTVQLPA